MADPEGSENAQDGAANQDDLAAEWAAMAEGGDAGDTVPEGAGGAVEGGGGDDDSLAAEWAAMAGDGGGAADDANGGLVGAGDEFLGGADASTSGGQPTRVLNQDEIDSLLGFGDGDGDAQGKSGIYAMLNSTLVTYERLPMLEVVFDRLVRLMTTSLRNFTSDNVEVSIDGMSSVRFGDYLNSIPLPAMIGVFRVEEWDDFGLITIDSALIYSVVDSLLGGGRGTAPVRIEGRPYTTIERSLVQRMLEVVLDDMTSAFEPLTRVAFKSDRLETNPRFAAIARPANAAVAIRLRVEMDDRGGDLEIVIPYATLEPIRDLLLQMFWGEKFGRDSIWETHLATELWSMQVEIEAVLDEQVMSLRRIAALRVGDTLMLNARPNSSVMVRCSGIDMFSGSMGRSGDKVAVRVDRTHRKLGAAA